MATYQKCDRCGGSTETRVYLKFYRLSIEAQQNEYPDNLAPFRDNTEICGGCLDQLRQWLRTPPASKVNTD